MPEIRWLASFALALILAAPAGVAQEPAAEPESDTGSWSVERRGRSDVAIVLDADKEIEGWMDSVRPRLVIECRNAEPAASIRFGIPPLPDREDSRQFVTLRFDNDRLIQETLSVSEEDHSLAFAYPQALIDKMKGHERLLVRVRHLAATPAQFNFDLRGLEAVVDPVLEACSSAFDQGDEIMVAGIAGVGVPVLIEGSHVVPAYPAKARRESIESQVVIRAVVRADGAVEQARVTYCSHPGYGFEEAAIEAFGQWRYQPATWQNQPVSVHFMTLVYFSPDG